MGWVFGEHDQYRDPNGMPNLAALQSNLQLQKEVGFIKNDIDVKRYSDVSMVTEASKRLT
jgi:NitT/TauT family transport system substrate-binding protein